MQIDILRILPDSLQSLYQAEGYLLFAILDDFETLEGGSLVASHRTRTKRSSLPLCEPLHSRRLQAIMA